MQTEVVNRTIEVYLRCFTSDKPKEWVCWISWAAYCCSTSVHSAIKMSPFKAVYGHAPPIFLSYMPGTTQVDWEEQELKCRDQILKRLTEHLQAAQVRTRKYHDAH